MVTIGNWQLSRSPRFEELKREGFDFEQEDKEIISSLPYQDLAQQSFVKPLYSEVERRVLDDQNN